MLKLRRLIFIGLLLLLSARPALATPLSFELGFAAERWSVAGNASTVGTVVLPLPFPSIAVSPTHGVMQALLGTDGMTAPAMEVFFGMSTGFLTTADANGNAYTRGSGLKREFSLAAGDTVTFDWTFVSGDTVPTPDSPFNDAAFFITNVATQELLSSVFLAGGLIGATNSGTFTATTGGSYSLGVGIFDQTDVFEFGVSYLTVDNFNVHQATGEVPGPTPVPEPGTLLMLTGGFAAVLTARRYRMN